MSQKFSTPDTVLVYTFRAIVVERQFGCFDCLKKLSIVYGHLPLRQPSVEISLRQLYVFSRKDTTVFLDSWKFE